MAQISSQYQSPKSRLESLQKQLDDWKYKTAYTTDIADYHAGTMMQEVIKKQIDSVNNLIERNDARAANAAAVRNSYAARLQDNKTPSAQLADDNSTAASATSASSSGYTQNAMYAAKQGGTGMEAAVAQNKTPFIAPFPDGLAFSSFNPPHFTPDSGASVQNKASPKSAVETSSAMGYNGSIIDPIHLLAGGLPGLGGENAYGGSAITAGNYSAQPYQGQAFDNIQTLTSSTASGGTAQTSEDSADTELQKDLREQYYRHDLLAAQIEIAKKTESDAKTGDASRAARAVRDALNKELEKVSVTIAGLESGENADNRGGTADSAGQTDSGHLGSGFGGGGYSGGGFGGRDGYSDSADGVRRRRRITADGCLTTRSVRYRNSTAGLRPCWMVCSPRNFSANMISSAG